MSVYFPHTIEKQLVAFGACHNRYYIYNNIVKKEQIVPIFNLSKEKMFSHLRSISIEPGKDQTTQITLPVLAFELTSQDYDEDRKQSSIIGILSNDGKQMLPNLVPYNFTVDLHLMSKYSKEIYDIDEQIAVTFRDAINYTMTFVKFRDGSKVDRSVEISLTATNIGIQETDIEKEGERILSLTWTFLMKGWLMMPMMGAQSDITGNRLPGEPINSQRVIDSTVYVGESLITEIDLTVEEDWNTWKETFTLPEV